MAVTVVEKRWEELVETVKTAVECIETGLSQQLPKIAVETSQQFLKTGVNTVVSTASAVSTLNPRP